ncbi:hypothetical protein [Planctomicrobium piriforme]|uniref:hypothetical protein n=1 Tax=Planctomicrobium piriforme TaxID=1576369 RepID=UPI0011138BAC|nr:hypothetical protein [Planctomicrobium piriforme]
MSGLAALACFSAVSADPRPLLADPIQAPPAAIVGDPLMAAVDDAIQVTRLRNLDFQQHTPWQILHGLLALRSGYTLKNGDQFVNALDFISSQARYKGDAWFEATQYGAKAHPYNGTPYDFEGHVNQTLAIISMCDVPTTHVFRTGDGRSVTMADMIRNAQMTVNSQEETTWTLWFLTHYLDQETTWTNNQGQRWSMESLVRIQTAASPYNAPCGGCHGLFALAYARNAYMQKHGQLRGSWLEADQKLQQYIAAAQSMQNRDGSFATQFFKARGYSNDFNERIKSSGHMLEWLLVALPKKRLEEPWIRNGVQTLANDLIKNASAPADCGPLYHSLHALILYKQRMQPENTPSVPSELAARPQQIQQPAGALTLSAPDGESMPLSKQQQLEQQAIAKPILNAPVKTAEAPISTKKEEFQAPVRTAVKPVAPTQNDIIITPAMTPSTAPPTTLQAATPANPPVLVAPPTATAQPAPKGPTQKAPARVVEQPRLLRRLSSEGENAETKTEQADESAMTPSELAPIIGGMPIFKLPDYAQNAKAAQAEKAAATPTADKPAEPEAPKPTAEAAKEPEKLKVEGDAKPAAQEAAKEAKPEAAKTVEQPKTDAKK